MLDALKFVKGAVARKDPVPVLTHYRIKDGVICGFNGLICMASPIALALDCQPKAQPFTEAIKICEELESTPSFAMTPAGRLTVKSGKFKVHIECSPEEYPPVAPEGEQVPVEPGLLEAFKTLAPMIGQDASRPWARGILLRDGSAFATNNVVIGEYWVGYKMPFDMNVPEECIKEVLRVKQDPTAISATARSITFHFDNGRWIKSQLLTTDWPNVGPVLNKPSNATPVPPDFFDILGRIAAYADQSRKVHFLGNTLATHTDDGVGASVLVDDPVWRVERGTYNIDLLRALDGLVAKIDFSLYPQPALFFGPDSTAGYPLLRGAVVGMKP
jgi:hypothetical protein